jgi:hypothetical protein
MNVPEETLEMPSWQTPSGPGIESPQTLIVVATSLNRTPPGRQDVLAPPGGITVVTGSTWQIGASSTGGAGGPGLGQTPPTGVVGLGFGQKPSTGPGDGFGFGQTPSTGPGDGSGFGQTPATGPGDGSGFGQ